VTRNNRDGFLKKKAQRYQLKKFKQHKERLKYQEDLNQLRNFNDAK
tara:strand:- start:250 stop:387 length:138 start_codon:yes stop_codon:yes gene_type:complete